MFRVFQGQTADDVWQEAASAFRHGDGIIQSSRVGETREILHSAMSIADPTQRWVISRFPPINPAFAIAEVVWLITGRNDSAFLNYFNQQLPKYAGRGSTYHGAYGYRLRHHLGIDQLERAYQALKGKPYSRQAVLQIWDGKVDLPDTSGEEASPDVPCNIMSILKVRRGKLEWMQILRSNDLYRGLPYNLVQFTSLQEVIAGWLEVEIGEYNQVSNSLHVYSQDLENISDSLPNEAAVNTDSLAFAKKDSEDSFKELSQQIESIINPNTSADELMSKAIRLNLPQPFRNMFCLLCAEGARRRQRFDMANKIMADCTNSAYKQLYDRWLMRFLKPASSVHP